MDFRTQDLKYLKYIKHVILTFEKCIFYAMIHFDLSNIIQRNLLKSKSLSKLQNQLVENC